MTWWLYDWDDPRDQWFADDKVAHFFGAWVAMCLTHSWLACVIAILLVEAVELGRWLRWRAKRFPQPWPFLTDRVSLKDIAVGLLGALCGSVL